MEFSPFRAFLPNIENIESTPIQNPNLYNLSALHEKSYGHVVNSNNPKIKFDMFLSKGWYKQALIPKLWMYKQSYNNVSFKGLIGLASVYDFFNGIIKPHEKTLPKREKLFLDYLNEFPVHAEPVCLSTDEADFSNILNIIESKTASISFEKDGKTHELWELDFETISNILAITENLKDVYIADGHHRMASAAKYFSDNNENPSSRYFLSFLAPANELNIYPYHRTVKISDREKKELLNFINEKHFQEIHNIPLNLISNEIIIEMDNKRYIKKIGLFDIETPYEYINKNILGPILNIHDIKTSKRINFQPGEKNLMELTKEELNIDEIRFFLPPISFNTIKHYSDNNLSLPPKSSWILPKMLTGLTLFDIRNH